MQHQHYISQRITANMHVDGPRVEVWNDEKLLETALERLVDVPAELRLIENACENRARRSR